MPSDDSDSIARIDSFDQMETSVSESVQPRRTSRASQTLHISRIITAILLLNPFMSPLPIKKQVIILYGNKQ